MTELDNKLKTHFTKTPDAPPSPPTPDPLNPPPPTPPSLEIKPDDVPPQLQEPPAKPPVVQPPAAPPAQPDPVKNMRERFEADKASMTATIAELTEKLTKAAVVNVKETPEFKEIQQKLTEASDNLSRISLEFDPRFKAKYETPIQNAVAEADELAKSFELPDGFVNQLLPLNMKQRAEVLKDLDPTAKAALVPILSKHDSLVKEKDAALRDHKTTLPNVEAEFAARANEQAVRVRNEIAVRALDALAQEHVLFRELPGDEDWNGKVRALRQQATELLVSGDAEKQVVALMQGSLAPIYKGWYVAVAKQLEQAQAEIASIKQRFPELGSGNPPPPKPADGKIVPMTAKDAAAAAFAKSNP